MIEVNKLLKQKAYRNIPLNFEEAYKLGKFTLSPYNKKLLREAKLPKEQILVQSVAALCAFHNREIYLKPESAEQIAGICAAVFDFDIALSKYGFLNVEKNVMDNCGMGGDLYRTPNLSTLAAIVAAAGGVPMLKHGSPGNTDNAGSSDFLQHCGVNMLASPANVGAGIKKYNFGYTEALDEGYKKIHTQTHNFAKLAHMNDIIGPITNPVNPRRMTRRVVGINHLIPPERVADAYRIMNETGHTFVERGLFIRGYATDEMNGGVDEVALTPGGTVVAHLRGNEIETYRLYANDFGLPEMNIHDLDPGTNKAETSLRLLKNEIHGPMRDAVLANAALLFYLHDNLFLEEGVEKARCLLESGKPYQLIQAYASLSRGEVCE